MNEPKLCSNCGSELVIKRNVYKQEGEWLQVAHSIWKCKSRRCAIELYEILSV